VTVKNFVFLDVTPLALVRNNVSEEGITSIIRMRRIGELVFVSNVLRLLVIVNVLHSTSPDKDEADSRKPTAVFISH
jgi:hypothetical protein